MRHSVTVAPTCTSRGDESPPAFSCTPTTHSDEVALSRALLGVSPSSPVVYVLRHYRSSATKTPAASLACTTKIVCDTTTSDRTDWPSCPIATVLRTVPSSFLSSETGSKMTSPTKPAHAATSSSATLTKPPDVPLPALLWFRTRRPLWQPHTHPTAARNSCYVNRRVAGTLIDSSFLLGTLRDTNLPVCFGYL